MSKSKKRSKMFSIVEQWQQGGMSQKAFSQANGIPCIGSDDKYLYASILDKSKSSEAKRVLGFRSVE